MVSTGFGARSAAEAAPPQDYQDFVASTARLASSEDVAQVILKVASDGSDRLRYVATKDIEPLVRARRETSEEAYIEPMRSKFLGTA